MPASPGSNSTVAKATEMQFPWMFIVDVKTIRLFGTMFW